GVLHEPDAGRARDQLDGAVVVCRPEPARHDAEIRLEPILQRRLELGRIVADDLDPRRLDAEAQQLRSQKRAVAVVALPANELAAGDDDDPAGAGQAWVGATIAPVRVTSTVTEWPPPGNVIALPLTLAFRLAGLPMSIHRRFARKKRLLCRSSVPVKSARPLTE